eukprot:COSAG03_NODE_26952_length_256_cov_0.649682_1_plen_56_part_10
MTMGQAHVWSYVACGLCATVAVRLRKQKGNARCNDDNPKTPRALLKTYIGGQQRWR